MNLAKKQMQHGGNFLLGRKRLLKRGNMTIEMKSVWDIKEPKDRRDMNWAEAKWAKPTLRPMGDWDNDGVKNQFDCRPLNRKKQHVEKEHDPSSKWKIRTEREFSTVGDIKEHTERNRSKY